MEAGVGRKSGFQLQTCQNLELTAGCGDLGLGEACPAETVWDVEPFTYLFSFLKREVG